MPRYWFRQKTFGYGATPNTWQGWVFTLVGVALIFGITFGTQYIGDDKTRVTATFAGLVVVLVSFIWISYIKTEGGWRWRN